MKQLFLLCCFFSSSALCDDTEKISFKKDVMPVISKNCINCHNSEDESPSMLFMDNYKLLVKGDSKHGPVVLTGKGEESLLIKKMRGITEIGKPMPKGKKSLPEEVIKKISMWIDQGAKNN